jgi:hypothetical protein
MQMPVNWNELDRHLDDVVAEAAGKTDDRLATEISALTRMTRDEVRRLFPDEADARALVRLMRIVKDGGDRNRKIRRIVDNAEEFGGVLLTALDKLI